MNTLVQLRKDIDTIDSRLIDLLAKRFSVVATIGAYKKKHQLSIVDTQRWDDVLHIRCSQAKTKGLSEKFIIDVRERIHNESLKIQQ